MLDGENSQEMAAFLSGSRMLQEIVEERKFIDYISISFSNLPSYTHQDGLRLVFRVNVLVATKYCYKRLCLSQLWNSFLSTSVFWPGRQTTGYGDYFAYILYGQIVVLVDKDVGWWRLKRIANTWRDPSVVEVVKWSSTPHKLTLEDLPVTKNPWCLRHV